MRRVEIAWADSYVSTVRWDTRGRRRRRLRRAVRLARAGKLDDAHRMLHGKVRFLISGLPARRHSMRVRAANADLGVVYYPW